MKRFFLPAIMLMSNLSYWKKFLLIGFLLVLPIIIVGCLFIETIHNRMTFIEKEQVGVTYIDLLKDLLEDSHSGPNGLEDKNREVEIRNHIQLIDAFNAGDGAKLEVTGQWNALKEELYPFSRSQQNNKSRHEEQQKALGEINRRAAELIAVVGNNSNLILDPNFDSYYLMDSVVLRIPAILRTIHQLSLITSDIARQEDKAISQAQLLEIASLRNELRRNYNAIQSNLNMIYRKTEDPSIQSRLSTPSRAFEQEVGAFLDQMDQNFALANQQAAISPAQIAESKQAAMESTFRLYDAESQALNRLLTARLHQEPMKVIFSSVLTIATVFAIIYLLAALYMTIAQAVKNLESSSKQIVAKGDPTALIQLQSNDALFKQIETSFNEMALRFQGDLILYKQAQQELEQSRREAEEALKQTEFANQKQSQFLALMNQEFKTPLNAIIGYSEMIEKGIAGQLTDKQKKYAQSIALSGHHLLNVINDLLDMTKMEAGAITLHPECLNLATFLGELKQMVSELVDRKSITLLFDVEPGLESIYADPRRLRQIYLNLLSNAIKFSDSGERIHVRLFQSESWIVSQICDNGIGIPEEKQSQLFNGNFPQAGHSPPYHSKGAGLGLLLTKRLVELHGGEISLESREGVGTAVTFKLPVNPAADCDVTTRGFPASTSVMTQPVEVIQPLPDVSEIQAIRKPCDHCPLQVTGVYSQAPPVRAVEASFLLSACCRKIADSPHLPFCRQFQE